jgi:hypothetical protein
LHFDAKREIRDNLHLLLANGFELHITASILSVNAAT